MLEEIHIPAGVYKIQTHAFHGCKGLKRIYFYGDAPKEAYDTLTGQICDLLSNKLGIPGSAVYVTYHPVSDWGWNGANF